MGSSPTSQFMPRLYFYPSSRIAFLLLYGNSLYGVIARNDEIDETKLIPFPTIFYCHMHLGTHHRFLSSFPSEVKLAF
jgi:hypothetical protein